VWWPGAARAGRDRVAVVSVSYNTRELTGLLLWSLRRIVDWPGLEIVIVDNGSRDGSAELLAEAGRAGVCVLLANDVNRQHGPGLNQGISWLACRPGPLPAWIWILDSDVAAARPEVLCAARAAADSGGAALAGEPQWDPWHQASDTRLCCGPSATRRGHSQDRPWQPPAGTRPAILSSRRQRHPARRRRPKSIVRFDRSCRMSESVAASDSLAAGSAVA